MQWDEGPNAGFSQATPWLPVPPSYKTHNVATELKDPNSVLQFYQRVLALRHQNRVLLDGEYIALNENNRDHVLRRRDRDGKQERALVFAALQK
jgi:glycosidase